MKKFYNIEGIIRNGFKLSRDYEILDFNFTKLGDSGVKAFVKSVMSGQTGAPGGSVLPPLPQVDCLRDRNSRDC